MPCNYCYIMLCDVFIALLSEEISTTEHPVEQCPSGVVHKTPFCEFHAHVSSSFTSTQC